MAIKYITIPEKKMTVGILENTEFDAVLAIQKKLEGTSLGCTWTSYLMPTSFKSSTVCHPDDEFDVEVGKQVVKDKLLKNYYKSLDKKFNQFEQDVKKLYDNLFVDEKSEL